MWGKTGSRKCYWWSVKIPFIRDIQLFRILCYAPNLVIIHWLKFSLCFSDDYATAALLSAQYLGLRVTTLRMDWWQWNGVLLQWAEESVIGCIVPAVDITAPCPAPGPPQVLSLDQFNITPITIKLKPHVNYREHSLGLNYDCSNYTIIRYKLKTYVNAICTYMHVQSTSPPYITHQQYTEATIFCLNYKIFKRKLN